MSLKTNLMKYKFQLFAVLAIATLCLWYTFDHYCPNGNSYKLAHSLETTQCENTDTSKAMERQIERDMRETARSQAIQNVQYANNVVMRNFKETLKDYHITSECENVVGQEMFRLRIQQAGVEQDMRNQERSLQRKSIDFDQIKFIDGLTTKSLQSIELLGKWLNKIDESRIECEKQQRLIDKRRFIEFTTEVNGSTFYVKWKNYVISFLPNW